VQGPLQQVLEACNRARSDEAPTAYIADVEKFRSGLDRSKASFHLAQGLQFFFKPLILHLKPSYLLKQL
jgi:hypothetical protein